MCNFSFGMQTRIPPTRKETTNNPHTHTHPHELEAPFCTSYKHLSDKIWFLLINISNTPYSTQKDACMAVWLEGTNINRKPTSNERGCGWSHINRKKKTFVQQRVSGSSRENRWREVLNFSSSTGLVLNINRDGGTSGFSLSGALRQTICYGCVAKTITSIRTDKRFQCIHAPSFRHVNTTV